MPSGAEFSESEAHRDARGLSETPVDNGLLNMDQSSTYCGLLAKKTYRRRSGSVTNLVAALETELAGKLPGGNPNKANKLTGRGPQQENAMPFGGGNILSAEKKDVEVPPSREIGNRLSRRNSICSSGTAAAATAADPAAADFNQTCLEQVLQKRRGSSQIETQSMSSGMKRHSMHSSNGQLVSQSLLSFDDLDQITTPGQDSGPPLVVPFPESPLVVPFPKMTNGATTMAEGLQRRESSLFQASEAETMQLSFESTNQRETNEYEANSSSMTYSASSSIMETSKMESSSSNIQSSSSANVYDNDPMLSAFKDTLSTKMTQYSTVATQKTESSASSSSCVTSNQSNLIKGGKILGPFGVPNPELISAELDMVLSHPTMSDAVQWMEEDNKATEKVEEKWKQEVYNGNNFANQTHNGKNEIQEIKKVEEKWIQRVQEDFNPVSLHENQTQRISNENGIQEIQKVEEKWIQGVQEDFNPISNQVQNSQEMSMDNGIQEVHIMNEKWTQRAQEVYGIDNNASQEIKRSSKVFQTETVNRAEDNWTQNTSELSTRAQEVYGITEKPKSPVEGDFSEHNVVFSRVFGEGKRTSATISPVNHETTTPEPPAAKQGFAKFNALKTIGSALEVDKRLRTQIRSSMTSSPDECPSTERFSFKQQASEEETRSEVSEQLYEDGEEMYEANVCLKEISRPPPTITEEKIQFIEEKSSLLMESVETTNHQKSYASENQVGPNSWNNAQPPEAFVLPNEVKSFDRQSSYETSSQISSQQSSSVSTREDSFMKANNNNGWTGFAAGPVSTNSATEVELDDDDSPIEIHSPVPVRQGSVPRRSMSVERSIVLNTDETQALVRPSVILRRSMSVERSIQAPSLSRSGSVERSNTKAGSSLFNVGSSTVGVPLAFGSMDAPMFSSKSSSLLKRPKSFLSTENLSSTSSAMESFMTKRREMSKTPEHKMVEEEDRKVEQEVKSATQETSSSSSSNIETKSESSSTFQTSSKTESSTSYEKKEEFSSSFSSKSLKSQSCTTCKTEENIMGALTFDHLHPEVLTPLLPALSPINGQQQMSLDDVEKEFEALTRSAGIVVAQQQQQQLSKQPISSPPLSPQPIKTTVITDDEKPANFKALKSSIELKLSQQQDESQHQETLSKLKLKRQRNRTLDYHDLYPSAAWSYNGKVAQYTQKTYVAKGKTATATNKEEGGRENESNGEPPSSSATPSSLFDVNTNPDEIAVCSDGLGQGLGIILDKLRSIETKLDEIKTMEQNVWYPETDAPKPFPKVGQTPSASVASIKDFKQTLSDLKGSLAQLSLDQVSSPSQVEAAAAAASSPSPVSIIVSDEEDVTLANDLGETTDAEVEEVLPTNEGFLTTTTAQQMNNVLISSPSPTFERASSLPPPSHSQQIPLNITSVLPSDSEAETSDDDLAGASEEAQVRRIEELSRRILEEKTRLEMLEKIAKDEKEKEKERERLKGLDTLSERSEDDADDEGDRQRHRSSNSKTAGQSHRVHRTRSASRDRSLAKIKFCWRCHQTGHESYDCGADINPGNWCPRCLEKTHWEDNCWVDLKESLCQMCSLPGHITAVHDATDFRQRKLILETFGWLAFKEWFREPDFWSWWNISGYTNVPLYKLMQQFQQGN